ncbi:hypothetical protein D3C79_539730 [compost metagenome]
MADLFELGAQRAIGGIVEQPSTTEAGPGHRLDAQLLALIQGAVQGAVLVERRDLQLVGDQREVEARLQQLELAGAEVGHPGVLDLARLLEGDEGIGDRIGIQQRIRAVDQQQIQMVGTEFLQGGLGTGDDVGLAGVVVVEGMLRLGGEGDAALADDFHPAAQGGLEAQGVTEGLLALITAVDVGVIYGGHPQIQVVFHQIQQRGRGELPLHQAPVAHDEAGEGRTLGVQGETGYGHGDS